MVSDGTLVTMALCALTGIAAPVALAWWLVRKHHARLVTILVGAVVLSKSLSASVVEIFIFSMAIAVGAAGCMLARKL